MIELGQTVARNLDISETSSYGVGEYESVERCREADRLDTSIVNQYPFPLSMPIPWEMQRAG